MNTSNPPPTRPSRAAKQSCVNAISDTFRPPTGQKRGRKPNSDKSSANDTSNVEPLESSVASARKALKKVTLRVKFPENLEQVHTLPNEDDIEGIDYDETAGPGELTADVSELQGNNHVEEFNDDPQDLPSQVPSKRRGMQAMSIHTNSRTLVMTGSTPASQLEKVSPLPSMPTKSTSASPTTPTVLVPPPVEYGYLDDIVFSFISMLADGTYVRGGELRFGAPWREARSKFLHKLQIPEYLEDKAELVVRCEDSPKGRDNQIWTILTNESHYHSIMLELKENWVALNSVQSSKKTLTVKTKFPILVKNRKVNYSTITLAHYIHIDRDILATYRL
jgi:hypothetical protein